MCSSDLMNISYLHAVAPRLKVLGLCHSVYWTVRGLCDVVGVPFDEVSYWSAGVNHQAWVLRWERDGQSLYPMLDERIAGEAAYVIESFRQALAAALERAQAAGELQDDQTVVQRIEYLVVMIQALFSLAYLSREAADQLAVRTLHAVNGWRRLRPAGAVTPFQNVSAGIA